MDFQVESDFPTAGVPALKGATGNAGVIIATADSANQMVGITVGTASENDANLLKVMVNPDAIIRMKLSGGAASDTALSIFTVDTAASNSTVLIDGLDADPAGYEDCIVWGYSGTNIGQQRAVATVDGTDGVTVLNAYSAAHAVGDQVLFAARFPGVLDGITLTTDFTQSDATDENTDAAEFVVIGGEFRTVENDGTTNSYLHVVSQDHAFSGSALA
jgi:hypothetical protein